MNEQQLNQRLQTVAVDGRVHVMHRPMKQQGDDAELDTTFAYILCEPEGELIVAYAVAQKNPKDNFCRRIGRLIAKGRLWHYGSEAPSFCIEDEPLSAEEWRALDDLVVSQYIAEYYHGR